MKNDIVWLFIVAAVIVLICVLEHEKHVYVAPTVETSGPCER